MNDEENGAYQILQCVNIEMLKTNATRYINEGYVPLGPAEITMHGCLQTMWREPERVAAESDGTLFERLADMNDELNDYKERLSAAIEKLNNNAGVISSQRAVIDGQSVKLAEKDDLVKDFKDKLANAERRLGEDFREIESQKNVHGRDCREISMLKGRCIQLEQQLKRHGLEPMSQTDTLADARVPLTELKKLAESIDQSNNDPDYSTTILTLQDAIISFMTEIGAEGYLK